MEHSEACEHARSLDPCVCFVAIWVSLRFGDRQEGFAFPSFFARLCRTPRGPLQPGQDFIHSTKFEGHTEGHPECRREHLDLLDELTIITFWFAILSGGYVSSHRDGSFGSSAVSDGFR